MDSIENFSDEKLEVMRGALLSDFNSFNIAFTDSTFYQRDIHWPLCRHMQFGGNRKIVVLPRNFLKTTTVSNYALWKATSAFYAGKDIRILYASNTAPNSEKKLHRIRMIVENNQMYQSLFPDIVPNFNRTRWSDRAAELVRRDAHEEATFETAGTSTNITGRHYDVIIQDDTVAPKKDDLTEEEVMPSKEDIEQAIGWHKLCYPLLISMTEGEVLISGTRWTSYDLIRYVLDTEKYAVYQRAAIETDESGQAIATYPLRFPLESLEELKRSMGSYMFSALYMNKPLAGEHMVFKPEWIHYIPANEMLDGYVEVSVDPAISKRNDADFTCVMAIRHLSGTMLVEEIDRRRMSPNETISSMFRMATKYNAQRIYVEAIAYQEALVYMAKDEMVRTGEWFTIEPVKSRSNKEERIRGLQPFAERNQLLFRTGLHPIVESEFIEFPYGKNDDTLDCVSMQLPAMQLSAEPPPKKHPGKGFIITMGDVMDELHGRANKRKESSYYGA